MFSLHDAISSAMDSREPTRLQNVKHLLQQGYDVNKRDSTFRTPLDYTISLSHHLRDSTSSSSMQQEVVQLLLEHKADPNLQDSGGWTFLHQAAWNGDLPLIQQCVQYGNGTIMAKNNNGSLPVDLAAMRGHHQVTKYLDSHSGDLRHICRAVIHEALGKRVTRLRELPLPLRLKLFLNYGIPYDGFSAVLVPPEPWSSEELWRKDVKSEEIASFIKDNASSEFLEEHRKVLYGEQDEEERSETSSVGARQEELVRLFKDMYLWEYFRNVSYEEPLAREPRYSLEPVQKE